MAATVLNSSKAIETSVFVVRAFVRLRQLSLRHGELARRIADIENHITSNDKEIAALIKTVGGPSGPNESGLMALLHQLPSWKTSSAPV